MSEPLVGFKDRSGAAWLPPDGLTFQVDRLRWHYQGGSDDATLTATGAGVNADELAQILRYGVEIYDSQGDLWFGYVNKVKITRGSMTLGISLDDMANKVGVIYSVLDPGDAIVGWRKTTAWLEDADSQTAYGIKEMLVPKRSTTDEVALQQRATELAIRKYPVMLPTFGFGFGMDDGLTTITLECKGWIHTLAWKYYSEWVVNLLSWETVDTSTTNLGAASSNQKIVQQFTPTQSITALTASVYVKKVGSPTDNLLVAIYALDSSGNPTGSALGTATLAGTGITTSFAWYPNYAFSAAVECLNATMYGLVYSRSGAVDGSNYYQLNLVAVGGYSGGAPKVYNGSSWSNLTGDIPFKLGCNNKTQTSQQMLDVLTDCGQFLSGKYVETASGIYSGSYRNGDKTALEELLDHMDTGTSNSRPYCATVDKLRNIRIYEQPTADARLINADGEVFSLSDEKQFPWRVPVGVWYKVKDISPTSVTPARIARIDRFFAASVEWSRGSKVPMIEPLGSRNPISMLGLGSGLSQAQIQAVNPQWVYLTTPLTSTSFDGDSFSTTAKTLIDTSAVFGVPAGAKALYMLVNARDSGSAGTYCYLYLGANNTDSAGVAYACASINDRLKPQEMIVPCDPNGDIYYQISASGSGTFDLVLQVWGYYL